MSKEKIHLVIASANLLPGGAERVLSFLARNIDRTTFKVSFVIFGHEKDVAYDLTGLSTTFFGKDRILHGFIDFYKFLRREKPDVVITAVGHLNTMGAYLSWVFPKIKFVAREVTVLSVMREHANVKFNPFMWMSKHRFKYVDAVICQSDHMVEDIKTTYRFDYDKITIIHNPITDSFKLKSTIADRSEMKLITIGRISAEKGHERLISILKRLEFPYHYTIIGNGPDRDKILSLLESEGLRNKVTYIEYTSEVDKYLTDSHVFLLGSYTEGFPNAVLESAAVGTPILAYPAPGGLIEIIEEGINGYIVDTEDEYVEKLNSIYKDYHFKPEAVRSSVMKKFHSDIIINKYEALFKQLINK
ncbi:MAG: glycosyltransferase [Bacteroidia bacterium]|nr:glycosyltransferase [Bacteroidia bacterium]